MYFLQNVDRERKYKFLYLKTKQESNRLKQEIITKEKNHLEKVTKLSAEIVKLRKEKEKLTQKLTAKTFSASEKVTTQKLTEKVTEKVITHQRKRKIPTRTSSRNKNKQQSVLNSITSLETLELKEINDADSTNT